MQHLFVLPWLTPSRRTLHGIAVVAILVFGFFAILKSTSGGREAPAKELVTGSIPSSLLKNPRQNESSLIQFFNHESVEARMRGAFTDQGQLFSYISPEARVRTDHPLRKIRK